MRWGHAGLLFWFGLVMATACSSSSDDASTKTLPTSALFVTGANLDDEPGLELVFVDNEGLLHAGPWSIAVEVPEAEPYFVKGQAQLRVMDWGDAPLVVFIHPEEGVEDPPDLYQLFSVEETGLRAVYTSTRDHFAPLMLYPSGASYTEVPNDACFRTDLSSEQSQVVTIQRVFLNPGPSGYWEETSRDDTDDQFDCRDLAG